MSSNAAETLQLGQVNESLGALFIGLIISASFFGVTNVQTFLYYQRHASTRDPWTLRSLIGFLWCLDGLHLSFATHAVYTYLISNFANPSFAAHSVWSLLAQVPVSATSDLLVQLCYCRRLWIMSQKNKFLTIIAVLLAVLTFAFTLTFGIRIFFFPTVLAFGPSSNINWALYAALGTAVAADLWIALLLCYFLARSKTGWKATDTTASRLMVYIVNTGLLTSIVAIGCFVTYAALPSSYVYIAFYFNYSKLYFNALLAMLNARENLRGNLTAPMVTSQIHRGSIYKSTSSGGEMSMLRVSHLFSNRGGKRRDRPQSGVEEIKSRQRTISIDQLESGIELADCGFETTDKRDSKYSSMIMKDDSSLGLPIGSSLEPKHDTDDDIESMRFNPP